MKKLTVCCLALSMPLTSMAANRDVNRDGRIDQDDVTALARMVAGLDPVDLRYDQDGDNTLTLEDVNHLLDAIPAEAGPGAGIQTPATIQSPASPQSVGGLAFYAIRQKNTGQCVVVAGGEGISPGDTVYGVSPSFGEAQDLLTSQCSQGAAASAATNKISGLPLSNDRLYRPDETIMRGKWGTAKHIAEDAHLKSKLKEGGFVIEDGFFVAPGHGGDTEILWSHDGSEETLSGAATVIDCIDYCGRVGSVEFFVRGDGRDLWASGLVRHNDPARSFSVSLNGIREVRLVINDGSNGVDEDWGGWLNLKIGAPGAAATTTAVANAVALPSATDTVSSTLAIPIFEGDDTTKAIFVIDTENGQAKVIDRLRRTSAEVRSRPFHDNIFNTVGRSLGLPAGSVQILAGPIRKGNGAVHALLLVDTTTGAMGYITGLGDDPTDARLKKIPDLPGRDLASPDGNFSLVMRRDGSGATVGAYLVHGTTGRCAYFRDLEDLNTNIAATPTSSLPATEGNVSALALLGGSDATTHFLLIDNEKGTLSLVSGVKRKAAQLTVQTLHRNLVSSFPTETPVSTPVRFVPVPITTRSGSTDSALIIDVASGAMALLEHLTEPSKVRLIGVNRSIYGLLPANVGSPRSITAVPKIDDTGTTVGAWLFDSASAEILFLNNLQDPNNLEIRVVQKRDGG